MKIIKEAFGKWLHEKMNLIVLEKSEWYYLTKESKRAHEGWLNRPGWPVTRIFKRKIMYKHPAENVVIVNEPRIPLYLMIFHKHGKHKSPVDEEFKCLRCKREVPEVAKSVIMMENI